jgi:hypothetical protein
VKHWHLQEAQDLQTVQIDKSWWKRFCFEYYALVCAFYLSQSLLDKTKVFSLLFSSDLFTPKIHTCNFTNIFLLQEGIEKKKCKVCTYDADEC